MSSSEDYFLTLKTPRDKIALGFGVDVNQGSTDQLFIADADLGTLAAVVKLLVDKGVLADADVQTALTAAASGADGSVWTDLVTPPTGATFDDFEEEPFEFVPAGTTADATNTSFGRGQVGDSLLPSLGTMTIDSTVHQSGTRSLKTHTAGGWSRALRTNTYALTSTAYVRFYFKAAAPGTSNCRIFAFQQNPNAGTDIGADVWSLELAVDTAGHPTLIDNGTARTPTSPPNICNSAMWRVEVGLYGATCECRLWTGGNLQGTGTPSFSWTASYGAGAVNSALVGQPRSLLTSVQSWDTWHDDVAFATATWPPPF